MFRCRVVNRAWLAFLGSALFLIPSVAVGLEPPNREARPGRDQILALMRRVNQWQLAHPVMRTNDRNWERGTWYTGVMAAHKATGDQAFLQQAMDWGELHQWQVGTEKAGANRLFCAQSWIELYFITGKKEMIEPTVRWLSTASNNSPGGAEVWYLEAGRRYADSLYGASALAMLTKATGDRRYLDIMHRFFRDVQSELYSPEDGLFYRDKRFIGQTTSRGKKIFWSRGNGWVLGGLVRILEYLPETDPERSRYLELYQKMAGSVAQCQGADGLWRPNLGDAEDVPVPESSGTGFFCYALAWGVNRGVLDRSAYLPVVTKAWEGLAANVSPEGKVGWGQPVGDRPVAVKTDQTHEYVTGTFLLAGSEMWKLTPATGK